MHLKNYLIKQEDILNLKVNIVKIVIIHQQYMEFTRIKNIASKIKSATISKEATGKYYVSILFEMNEKVE